ncbi:endonuclease/exonuclease/phosphatase [Vibrio cidicii]|uniref:ExeM/NucH family extracellular endonuclease n=1 Tax=Vibrio cidicii TaxID=1763883 RepID=UPI00077FF33A|nr:ExeM/NucH family extracellular endonuclease [Vibrio cidicii]KYN80127.1 endonuclease/exonuclease/phosphatase [Vibrio cidicii]
MKKSLIAAAIGAVVAPSVHANIVISEITEGSGNNKAIEIANVGTASVLLDGYTVELAGNGKDWGNKLSLDGVTLASGQTYVIINSGAAADLKAKGNVESTVTYFNGNDDVAIKQNGTVIDIVGNRDGVDFNKDVTLRRTDFSPSTTYDANKFATVDMNDWSDFGNVDLGGGTNPDPDPDPDPDPQPQVLISALQGSGWASPYTDPANGKFISSESFTVEGVITAIQTQALDGDLPVGFFMQDETPDSDAKTSDGIFVAASVDGLAVGDKVRVTGPVEENYGWTQMPATAVEKTGTGSVSAVAVTALSDDAEFDFTLERYEGMLVKLTSTTDMKVSRSYSFDEGPQRYNLVLTQGKVNVHPNQSFFPGTQQAAQAADCNDDARLVVESFSKDTQGQPSWYPEFGKTDIDQNGSSEDYIRVGDRASNLQGVLGYSHSDYRLYVTEEANNDTFIARGNNRTQAPVLKSGDVRIATFNTDEYFNSLVGNGEANPYLSAGQTAGAENATVLQQQTAKLAAALVALDADIVGVIGVENNGFGESSAIVQLVSAVNAKLPEAKKYEIVKEKDLTHIGRLASSNYVIYRPSVAGIKATQVIAMPEQRLDGGQVIAQSDALVPEFSFKDRDETLTVAVTQFVDKDQACLEDTSNSDRQGACENLRVSAADYLGQKLAGIDGEKVILGNLNSYGKEDAITVLTNRTALPAGYKVKTAAQTFVEDKAFDSESRVIEASYGYENVLDIVAPKSFNSLNGDESGNLDYILTSAGLKANVLDAGHWHINAAESALFAADHSLGQNYADAYRAAEIDPVVVDISFAGKPLDPVDPTLPGDKPIVVGTPIALPSEPINEPRLEAPSTAGFKYLVDLTAYTGSSYLKVGDEVVVSFSDANAASVATSSSVAKDVLDEFEIALGWTEVPITGIAAGEYTVTTSIDGTVLERKQVAVADNSSDSDGGSTGLGALLALLGLGFLRRKFN